MTSEPLPILSTTPRAWGELAAANLDVFLADHAVCEQQAAQAALALVGQYPDDEELVERMTALAAEEIAHLRRVAALVRKRGGSLARRRPNDFVQALRKAIDSPGEPYLKSDRLFVGALIEARSCERFTRISEVLPPGEVRAMLEDFGPAEARHWRMFHDLARREPPAEWFETRWQRWLEVEQEIMAGRGTSPAVHG